MCLMRHLKFKRMQASEISWRIYTHFSFPLWQSLTIKYEGLRVWQSLKVFNTMKNTNISEFSSCYPPGLNTDLRSYDFNDCEPVLKCPGWPWESLKKSFIWKSFFWNFTLNVSIGNFWRVLKFKRKLYFSRWNLKENL